jgi:hypothetical protein
MTGTVGDNNQEALLLALERLRASASEGICFDCGQRMTPIEGLPAGVYGGMCATHGAVTTDGQTVKFSAASEPPDMWTDKRDTT